MEIIKSSCTKPLNPYARETYEAKMFEVLQEPSDKQKILDFIDEVEKEHPYKGNTEAF